MIDQYNRKISYLRLSVTERCQLRCAYCRAGEDLCPKENELSAEKMVEIVQACSELGIDRVRLTGGEPLLRRDIVQIIQGIRAIPAIKDISLTTNAQDLAAHAAGLKAAGLDRVNVSLDSLDKDKFKLLTGGDVDKVLEGIRASIECGLLPVKLNAVLVKGVNDSEIGDFIALAKDMPIDIRFIEYMEIGVNPLAAAKRVSSDFILNQLPQLVKIPPRYFGQPSSDYQIPGFKGRIGLISPISHQFCSDCNRIRIMSDGTLLPCLGRSDEVNLMPSMKDGYEALKETIREAIYHKPCGHEFGKMRLERGMSHIGG